LISVEGAIRMKGRVRPVREGKGRKKNEKDRERKMEKKRHCRWMVNSG
jgi:hypothetical protein